MGLEKILTKVILKSSHITGKSSC